MDEYFCDLPLGIPQSREEYSLRIIHFLNHPAKLPKGEIVSKLEKALLFINAACENYVFIEKDLEKFISELPVKLNGIIGQSRLKDDLGCFVTTPWHIRSKLVQVELDYYDKKEDRLIISLLKTTLLYLKCPIINSRIIEAQMEAIHSKDSAKRRKSKEFISAVTKAIKGESKAKASVAGYWYAYFVFKKLIEAIEHLQHESKTSQPTREYKNQLKKEYNISPINLRAMETFADTSQNIAYSILIENRIISSVEQYKNGVRKNVGDLRKHIPSISTFPDTFFIFLDFISQNPDVFSTLDPFQYLSNIKTLKVRREDIKSK